jgi:type I restriction enzyme S subunit
MTNFSGEPISSQTANAACGGPQGRGMDSRRTSTVADASAGYFVNTASASLNNPVPGGVACPPGFKQTEVGVIPEDWQALSIGAVTNWLSGGTPNRKRLDYWRGNIPWISGSTLKTLELTTSDQFLTSEGVDAGSKMAPLGSTLLLVRGSALHSEIRAGLVVSPLCFNQDVKALIPNQSVIPKYLTIYILAMEGELLKLVSSAGNSAGVLDTELVKNFKFLLPKKQEQTAIANTLSDVDALISELEKLIAKKQAIKTATMQQLLTGRTRLPQFALREDGTQKGTKPSELGEIPEDWDLKKLSKISPEQGVGLVINPSSYFSPRGTIPMLVASHVYENRIDCEGANRITPESNNKLPASRLRAGDIVMVRVGEPGVTAVIPDELDGCNCASMMIVRQGDKFVGQWLCYTMNSRIGRSQVESVQYGTAQKCFNIADAIDFKYPFPSYNEQTAIATILSDMDEELQALEQRLTKTRQIKQGMMQELLTGRTRLV